MSEVDEAIFRRFAEVLDERDEREYGLRKDAEEAWKERSRAEALEDELAESKQRELVLLERIDRIKIAEIPEEAKAALKSLESLRALVKKFYGVEDKTADEYALVHYERAYAILDRLMNLVID